jgi:hypothetical protein
VQQSTAGQTVAHDVGSAQLEGHRTDPGQDQVEREEADDHRRPAQDEAESIFEGSHGVS